MVKYILIDTSSKAEFVRATRTTLLQAATVMGVDESHIEWCLEEYNRCDVDSFILIKEEYDEYHPV